MATYASLSDDDKATLAAFMTFYRPMMGQVSRTLTSVSQMIDVYNSTASAIIATLDAGESVADPTGLAGAQPVPKADITAAITDLGAVLTAYNTAAKRESRIKAAGLVNN